MKRKPAAKPASTKITLTLPNDLLAVLDEACALENRTRSNFIAYSLHRMKEANPCLGEPRPPKGTTFCPKVTGKPCKYRKTSREQTPAQPTQ